MHARLSIAVATLVLAWGCAGTGRTPGATAESPLALQRVVLYRNGIGYFERSGSIDGDTLRLRVRKDQVNDLLKSLVVVDAKGRVLGVSLPLDPQSWHRAALAALTPGNGKLAEVLDSLRGTPIEVVTDNRRVSGRIVMVERLQPVSRPGQPGIPIVEPRGDDDPPAPFEDHKLTLLDGETMQVVLLSQVESLTLRDGDIAMQLHRHLDASAGEGMFQQVVLEVRLSGGDTHDLALSYVTEAPLWKPTYRLVLDDKQPGRALLQAWAVVDNTSGESWNDVALSLTSGAPLAFQYDLHTPRRGERPDLSHSAVHKQASVALGERTLAEPEMAPAPAPPAASQPYPGAPAMEESADADGIKSMAEQAKKESKGRRNSARSMDEMLDMSLGGSGSAGPAPKPMAPPVVSIDAMQQSGGMDARAARVSGLTRFDLPVRVTLPDGSATMVALIQKPVAGEQVFLYRPGGSGRGYELNPYRVVRFQNDTEFVLEPGPISIYAGGSFVGEGLSEAVGSQQKAVIPFAVEPSIMVRQETQHTGQKTEKVKLVRGVLEVEAFERVKTTWTVQGEGREAQRVLVRHPRFGPNYQLVDRPKETEDLADAYLVPVTVEKGQREAKLVLIEQTPSRMSVSLWDGNAVALLDLVLASSTLDAAERAKLEPIVKARREIGRIDTETGSLQEQREQLDQRAQETRASLKSIEKDKRAGALRGRLQARLEEMVKEADAIGRKIVDMQSKRLELKMELEDLIEKS